ncbi:MAG: hypothetical protein QMC67_14555 [Candidatus Wallbacteria bacterium]
MKERKSKKTVENLLMPDYQDSAWKDIIDAYFPEFLKFYFPKIYRDIDFNQKYEFLDKEFQKITKYSELNKKFVDKLIKVYLKTGEEKWILIHIEIQGTADQTFTERLYIYNYRIFDRYHKDVVTLAILADDSKKFRPESYKVKYWNFEHTFKFPAVKLLDYQGKIESLEKNDNPFAIATIAYLRFIETKNNKNKRLFWKTSLIKALYIRGFKKKDILNLYRFIDWLLLLPEDIALKFHEEINKFEEAKNMPYITTAERIGMQKGEQIGMQKGNRKIKQMINNLRKLGVSEEKIQQAIKMAEKDAA